jgi:hypothetical protein
MAGREVLRHGLYVLREMFSVKPVMKDGYVEEDPLHDLHYATSTKVAGSIPHGIMGFFN